MYKVGLACVAVPRSSTDLTHSFRNCCMSDHLSQPTEESALLSDMSDQGSKLPKSIYSLYIGVAFQHVENSTINADLISSIKIFTLVAYILQQALSVIFFVAALLRLLDVKDAGMKLFDETPLLSFDQITSKRC